MAGTHLEARHIQDHNAENITEVFHWGYATRVLPCTSGEGTCEYLDAVYWMHDVSMLYTFIMWGVILGILVMWVVLRGWRMGGVQQRMGGVIDSTCDAVNRAMRRWLLPDAPLKSVFGIVTRLQVVTLAVMLAYLLVFSLVGITYKSWVTPIEGTDMHNIRTGAGGWSDRIGALAYALTPFTILLANRESVLSWLTGIPYQHFNFLHRWCGRVIFIQSFLHTLVWTVVMGKLYQPQPDQYRDFLNQQYMIFGVVAMLFITFLTVFSTQRAIKWTGYEFFKVTHWIVAVLYIGACWGHWEQLYCWMVPSLALVFIDQAVRGLRILALHYRGGKGESWGFKCAQASMTFLESATDDQVIRLDFEYPHRQPWSPGQHFYLTFPSLSIWQAHPYTPSSLPEPRSTIQKHTYLIRVRAGQSAQLATLAAQGSTLPVILTGPYGNSHPANQTNNLLAIAGGTGVTFTLPIALATLRQPIVPQTLVDFVWVARRVQDLQWLQRELLELRELAQKTPSLRVKVFITREVAEQASLLASSSSDSESSSEASVHDFEKQGAFEARTRIRDFAAGGEKRLSRRQFLDALRPVEEKQHQLEDGRFAVEFLGGAHPSLEQVVGGFMERAEVRGGCVEVVGSGPEAMGSQLREAVAGVKTGESLGFYWDSRG
ncbi:hypothetical protein MBLNU230_g7055t1 [Neophaeotheca triangularis]